jgi:hypothetical protein
MKEIIRTNSRIMTDNMLLLVVVVLVVVVRLFAPTGPG